MLFSRSNESAFDADSFDTKIDENFENFVQSNSDGRPKFWASASQISGFDSPFVSKTNDAPYSPLDPPFSDNPMKLRLHPVGPTSDATDSIFTDKSKFLDQRTDFSDSQIDESDIDEPELLNVSQRYTEIIIEAGVHYNLTSPEGVPNPKWIIVTCDPTLCPFTPLLYNDVGPTAEGVLAARGTVAFDEGQPLIYRNGTKIPLSSVEHAQRSCIK